MAQNGFYPVRVDGALDEPLSRGLWLVKWLLLVPHLLVLAVLWPAFVVVTVAAFFSILVTGRYPRPLFDFTVGVLRWSWRVHYYGYAALGTDRYPPFTLADVPDYPARLSVDYPERLSRGLALVKTWLLALPHYLVVALFAGVGFGTTGDGTDFAVAGLIGLLVLIAGVVLLFTKAYPRPIHDFVIGMDRWVVRVVAYAALMTDEYPPFRLDEGGVEAGPMRPAASPRANDWTAGRVASVVVGAVLALTATGLLTGAAGMLWLDRTQRDADGYLVAPVTTVSSSGYAITTDELTVHHGLPVSDTLGRVRITVTATDPADPVFLGVGRPSDVDRYLAGVAHGVLTDEGSIVEQPGATPTGAAADQRYWADSVQGAGSQTVTWEPADGEWKWVAMNATAERGVQLRVQVAATLPALPWLAAAAAGAGAVLLACAALLIGVAAHRAATPPAPPAAPIPATTP
ncbi:DUF4389 domain-containing protein [Actinokineospora fastidiosa]|uniref:DUF4389 domain-containing protein n=1 Tax=Actinokineospora fastidiosa TaxID=1816 RepID=A0A918GC91_9PSEU|nr:DUF4389 domain-containing protein [Actinokineospora fastidiosa]GGS28542.1 hypothetical protein GCM10010171_22050 [Actinokineospora fastidiosa]